MDLRQCVDIPITVDTIQELDETFTVTLSLPSSNPDFPPIRVDPDLATVTIEDDDGQGNNYKDKEHFNRVFSHVNL